MIHNQWKVTWKWRKKNIKREKKLQTKKQFVIITIIRGTRAHSSEMYGLKGSVDDFVCVCRGSSGASNTLVQQSNRKHLASLCEPKTNANRIFLDEWIIKAIFTLFIPCVCVCVDVDLNVNLRSSYTLTVKCCVLTLTIKLHWKWRELMVCSASFDIRSKKWTHTHKEKRCKKTEAKM